jgi:cathepsin F
MKVLIACVLVVFAACVFAQESELRQQFIEFQHAYGKQYADATEFELRYAVFKSNVARAAKIQANDTQATWGVTKFMDMTPQEFKNTILMKNTIANNRVKKNIAKELPASPLASFDWRNHSPAVVTPVYNQGQCGSCWAFSITENIESQWALAGNTLTSLSMQQVVDCDSNDDGCNGGDPPTAYEYVISAGGLDSYSSYPYTAEDGSCSFNSANVVAKIGSYTTISSESQAQSYLTQNGPLSVCVDAESWQYYTGGIITTSSDCGTSLDHCVMITGYDTSGSTPYWWVRNSWGTDWGQSGYLQVQSGADVCGIAQEITSATGA